MWFSALGFAWCLAVGVLASLWSPRDHRTLDKNLISPAFATLFRPWPRCVRDRVQKYYDEIGSECELTMGILNHDQGETPCKEGLGKLGGAGREKNLGILQDMNKPQ